MKYRQRMNIIMIPQVDNNRKYESVKFPNAIIPKIQKHTRSQIVREPHQAWISIHQIQTSGLVMILRREGFNTSSIVRYGKVFHFFGSA